MPIHRLNHAVLYVRDVRRSVDFYSKVLGFHPQTDPVDGPVQPRFGLDQNIVVAKQAGARLQNIATDRGLCQHEIVEGPLCVRKCRRIGVDTAQQQPAEQREQQCAACSKREPHRGTVSADGPVLAGMTDRPR